METVKCTRRKGKEGEVNPCNTNIELIKENLTIIQPDTPLLAAVCPNCHRNRTLTKSKSYDLVKQYFTKELPRFASTSEQTQKSKSESESESESEPESKDADISIDITPSSPAPAQVATYTSTDDEGMPSTGLAYRVRDTMLLLGYRGPKWGDKIKAIVEFVRTTPTFQTPHGLNTLLASWGIDPVHIPLVVQKVFGSAEMAAGMSMMTGGYGQPQYQYPIYQTNPYSQSTNPYSHGQPPTIQVPPGQIVMIPQGSQAPISTIEELNAQGKVIKRITTPAPSEKAQPQPPPAPAPTPQPQQTIRESLTDLLTLLKEFGILNTKSEPAPAPKLADDPTIKTIAESVSKLTTQPQRNPELDEYKSMVAGLSKQIEELKNEKVQSELASLHQQVNELRNAKTNPVRIDPTLTDTQYDAQMRHNNLVTVTESAEKVGERLASPLYELLKQQQKLNTSLVLRDLERTDGVAPGTYLAAMQPQAHTAESVKSTVDKWKSKASK